MYINQNIELATMENKVSHVLKDQYNILLNQLSSYLDTELLGMVIKEDLIRKQNVVEQKIKKITKSNKNLEKDELIRKLKTKSNEFLNIIENNEVLDNMIQNEKNNLRQLLTNSYFEFVIVDNKNNQEQLRNKINKHKYEEDKQYFYITKGSIDGTHWFLVIQQGQDIYHIDSLGNTERKDFFDLFVKEHDSDTHFHYFNNQTKLQIHSGVCEMYSINLAFYLLRARLFNSVTNRFNELLLHKNWNEIKTDKDSNTLDPVFVYGMNENPFGVFSEKIDRVKFIEKQINVLQTTDKLVYGYDAEKNKLVTFNEKFIKDLNLAKELFDDYQRPTIENLRDKITNMYLSENTIEKIKHQQPKEKQLLFTGINNFFNFDDIHKQKLINTIEFYLKLNDIEKGKFYCLSESKREKEYNELLKCKEYNSKNYLEYNDFKKILDTFEIVRNSQFLCKTFLKENIFDLSNQNSFLRSGHMYFEAVRFFNSNKEISK